MRKVKRSRQEHLCISTKNLTMLYGPIIVCKHVFICRKYAAHYESSAKRSPAIQFSLHYVVMCGCKQHLLFEFVSTGFVISSLVITVVVSGMGVRCNLRARSKNFAVCHVSPPPRPCPLSSVLFSTIHLLLMLN